MLLPLMDILPPEDLARMRDALPGLVMVDGKATAGATARAVKSNQQGEGPEAEALTDFVKRSLDAHPLFQAATQLRAWGPVLISRYQIGMGYGLHVDNAFMRGTRSDLSFTLFLSDLDSYDGGGLRLELPSGTQTIRLPAGSLVLYPSTSLHEVETVTRGERWAVVGWVESRVLHTEAREALFDLANVRASLAPHASQLDPMIGLTLQKIDANLRRLFSQ